MKSTLPAGHAGFTLVELAIVLVIIGLIVGGVLVGQDMIKAAEVRATVGQVEKYNTALNTFRTKYNGLPGDLNATLAANFGMTARGGDGNGDGNGILGTCSPANITETEAGCETLLFWRDLSDAQLIDGSFNTPVDPMFYGNNNTPMSADQVPLFFPKAKIGRGNYFTVFHSSGINYYELAGILATDDVGYYTLALSLTPSEAFNMDNKIDDGKPGTGVVQAMQDLSSLNVPAADAGSCQVDASHYETTSSTTASTPACQLRFRFN